MAAAVSATVASLVAAIAVILAADFAAALAARLASVAVAPAAAADFAANAKFPPYWFVGKVCWAFWLDLQLLLLLPRLLFRLLLSQLLWLPHRSLQLLCCFVAVVPAAAAAAASVATRCVFFR